VHHDSYKVVVPGQAQVQHRQHGLCRDVHGHLVGDGKALCTMKFLGRQKARSQRAQLLQLGIRPCRQERVTRQRAVP
jgi:hypothetical protein